MNCPYPKCGGALAVRDASGYCLKCKRPVERCAACQTWNRADAVWCRKCGEALISHLPETGAAWPPEIFRRPYKLIALEEACWSPPQVAAGCLWSVGESGQLYRINPYSGTADKMHDFGEGAGYAGFVIRQMERSDDSHMTEQFAVCAARDRIMAVGLVSQQERIFRDLEPGEEILAECVDSYHLLDAGWTVAWALTSRGGQMRLLGADLKSGKAVRHELDASVAAGPILFEDCVMVWSGRTVWVLSNGAWKKVDLPASFEAWTAPQPGSGLRMPLGQMPAMRTSGAVYLPGSQEGGAALLMLQQDGGSWKHSVIPVPTPAACGQDALGQPLVSYEGRLAVCAGDALQEFQADLELLPDRVAYAAGDLRAFFCYGTPEERLRFCCGEEQNDVTLEFPGGFVECGGFWSVGTALASRFLTGKIGERRTEFRTWHV